MKHFKIHLILLLLTFNITHTFAEVVEDLKSDKIKNETELILFVKVQKVKATQDEKYQEFLTDKNIKGNIASCEVMYVLKGDYSKSKINLFFLKSLEDKINDFNPAPFIATLDFLVYLKKDKNDEYIPVHGHRNGEKSVKLLCYDRTFSKWESDDD